MFSHVFFWQSAHATLALLIGPTMSRAVLCEVRTNVISTPAGQIFFHSYFASRIIVYIEMGLLKKTVLLEENS